VHPRFETPAFAIVALAVWSALLAAALDVMTSRMNGRLGHQR